MNNFWLSNYWSNALYAQNTCCYTIRHDASHDHLGLQTPPRCLPDTSQMPLPRPSCVPDVFKMATRYN